MIEERYEISVWEDYIVPATYEEDSKIHIPEHYEENKIAVIGSSSMTSQIRVREPKLVENINGSNTFTFKLFYSYIDVESGEKKTNPFVNLLVNERKIKVLWKNKWYDFVIKNIQEDSSGKTIFYTCKDLFINELSKTGFDLEFDTELENNMGTIQELAEKVLEDTDWQLDTQDSDEIVQRKEEPVYEVKTKYNIDAIRDSDGSTVVVPPGKTVLVFYNQIQEIIASNQKTGITKIQFGYASEYTTEKNSQLAINAESCSLEFNWEKEETADGIKFLFFNDLENLYYEAGVSNNYRAERLVSNYKTAYDTKINRYVDVYEYTRLDPNDTSNNPKTITTEIYKYEASDFKDPTLIGNIITNSKDFVNTSGWTDPEGNLTFGLYPAALEVGSKSNLIFIESGFENPNKKLYINSGLQDTLFLPNGIQKGQKFIFRYKARVQPSNSNTVISEYHTDGALFKVHIGSYTKKNNDITISDNNNYFSSKRVNSSDKEWYEFQLTCKKSISKEKLRKNNFGIVLEAKTYRDDYAKAKFWVEEFQFFEEVYGEKIKKDESGKVTSRTRARINPGDMDLLALKTTSYRYYDPTQSYSSEEDIEYLYCGNEDWNDSGLKRVSNGFTKVRSITAKNSNRFNILQSLAETFECWIQFEIQHDQETGRIIYKDGIPQKKVKIKKDIGKEVGTGFVYGIDLKTISRNIVSDQIATKVIVTANNNEFAKNGSCNIARSKENYSKANFILDFGYYINHGLLDGGQLNKDLYSSTLDSIGYFYNLNQYNARYDGITEEIVNKKTELDNLQSTLTVYETSISEAEEALTGYLADFKTLVGKDYKKLNKKQLNNAIKDFEEAAAIVQKIVTVENIISNYKKEIKNLEENVNFLNEEIKEANEEQDKIIEDILILDKKFYSKYSRFIQEGSWTSDEYLDDDLYYLDAQNVAYSSSRPQISYNISVIRLSALEEYKNKVFNIGDISFIQDTEFFGYTWVNQLKTPYKEKVLISEITSNFDSPEQDSFKIQNYKTQFEDLFQRITATTQSLQYASGQYQKAANAFTENGEIKFDTLQNSIKYNEQLVIGAQNESIYQDNTGLTVTDIKNPNKKTKVTSGGVFISTDGGKTWKGAIRGDGISTQYLTAGAINVNDIIIYDGNYSTFRWDSRGINAFDLIMDEDDLIGVNTSKFVRFDRYGIYGINGYRDSEGNLASFKPINEEDIWSNANYALTWKGFLLKTEGGAVTISTEDDITVKDNNEKSRIKIGRIERDDNGFYSYGIRISDKNEAIVMETDDEGKLWLKDKLQIGGLANTNYTRIGNLGLSDNDSIEHGGRVIDANNNFIVYEDGHFEAKSGKFKGYIEATGGKIGNMSISAVEEATMKVEITSNNGTVFKGWNQTKTLTATLYEGNVSKTENVSYQWYKDGNKLNGETSNTLQVKNTDGDPLDVYSCEITF